MLSIRRASEADCALIRRLAGEVFPATYREILAPAQLDYMMEWMYSEESLQGQFRAGHVWFIASSDGEPCGYVSVERQGEDLFHLQKIYVLPRFQGLGAGEFLFRRAVEYIRSVHPGPCMMELNVNRRNRALHFYERMGMRRLREGDFPIGDGYYMITSWGWRSSDPVFSFLLIPPAPVSRRGFRRPICGCLRSARRGRGFSAG